MRTSAAAVLTAALAAGSLLAGCSSSGGSPSPGPSTKPTTAPSTVSSGGPSTRAPSTAPGTTASPSDTASPVVPAPADPLRTVTTRAPDGTTHVVRIWADRHDATCYDHAYGQPVVTFLTTHPCQGLRRELATTTVDGRAVGMSIVETSFRSSTKNLYADTAAFRALVTRDGTGSIDDLLREGYRLPSGPTAVPSPDAFACLGQDDGVVIYDMWFLDGPTPTNDPALEQLAEDTFLQV